MYKTEKSYNIIQGKVPDFKKADIQLAITLDGKEIDTIPEKVEGTNYLVDVSCDTGEGSWNYSKWQVEVKNFQKGTKCNVAFMNSEEAMPNISDDAKVYFYYTWNEGTTLYISSIKNLDPTKSYMFFLLPHGTVTKAPAVRSISSNGKYSSFNFTYDMTQTQNHTPQNLKAPYLFLIENATTVSFQTSLSASNGAVSVYYVAIN